MKLISDGLVDFHSNRAYTAGSKPLASAKVHGKFAFTFSI